MCRLTTISLHLGPYGDYLAFLLFRVLKIGSDSHFDTICARTLFQSSLEQLLKWYHSGGHFSYHYHGVYWNSCSTNSMGTYPSPTRTGPGVAMKEIMLTVVRRMGRTHW